MKVLLTIMGEGREVDVPEPTNAEKEKLLQFALRMKLKDAAAGMQTRGGKWRAVEHQIYNWSIGGYYPHGSRNAP